MAEEKATFGAGCFWGVQAEFDRIKGVISTQVGFMGGTKEGPTYHDVCTGTTGHAEVVEVTYDPAKVSYEELLDAFWSMHDPTTRDRQGADVGNQYRSVIFYNSSEQKASAEASKAAQDSSGRFKRPIVTLVVPAATFWRAEEYHQKYLDRRGKASCRI